MKKEENRKPLNSSPKTDNDFRSRSQSPKAYLGCDTCKLKNIDVKKVKSISKFSDFCNQDRNKFKKPPLEKDDKGFRKSKVKLTDLCDEDKKRIVQLIEELSKLAEKNKELKDSLENTQKIREEQQDYIMKQANLHLEEKNFYINEINEYKSKVDGLENEMKNKTFQWENHERRKDSEIAYLAKVLQKSLKEKNEMNNQLSHLKVCLRHSLESFQRLRAEVTELQRQEQRVRKFKSTSCQTDINLGVLREKYHLTGEDSEEEGEEEEEFLSTCNQENVNAKSSLDIINDKLEYVYQLLKRKSECFAKNNQQKLDIDLSILLKNDKLAKEVGSENFEVSNDPLKDDEEKQGNRHKFSNPYDQCSKTSMQAERILKKIGKPLNLVVKELEQKTESDRLSQVKSSGDLETHSNVLQNKIVQKNDLFESTEDHQFDEDRLLEELFYSDHSLNFGLDSILRLEAKETITFYDPPFS